MSGCGGGKVMSNGGKVTPLKKKKVGGASESKGCPPGYYWSVQGCQQKAPGYKGPLSSLGAKLGVGIPLAGMLAAGTTAVVKGVKKFNEKRKLKKAAKVTPSTTTTTEQKRRGGAKYKSGGIAEQKIVAFPGYNARTDTMKMGGFKDLSGDGKITKKDVLIGRGVIKKPIKKK